ncbi:cytochrome b [Pseudoalteromonas mariniglutinosa]|uniref:cytochrome b n=1 Tax=Pseudoalteromonas mariniglutinosa TaxID=206042 RepID=UPI00384E6364
MLKNTKTSYGLIAILLHWLMAMIVFGLFGLGIYMVELTYYDSWYTGSLALHKSVGITLVAILLFRYAWRMLGTQPDPVVGSSKIMNVVAHSAHRLIYLILLVIVVSGYLISTADGRAIDVFSLFSVPAIDFSVANQEDIAGEIHFYAAYSLIGLVVLHALGALKHHFINKDKTLIRMIKPLKDD